MEENSLPILGNNQPDLASIRPDPDLESRGWQQRNLADPKMAGEAQELYESLGFEVHLRVLVAEDFGPQCKTCAEEACQSYVLIYTRQGKKDS